MKLISIVVRDTLPHLGTLGHIACDRPPGNLRGWRVCVRGPSVFLVSPPGWTHGDSLATRKTDGPCRAFEVPRTSCTLIWEGEGLEVTKYDSPPMMTPEERAAEVELARAAAGKKS